MTTFPLLRTGAVAQHPLQMTTGQHCQILLYLDGKDQRYRTQGHMLRSWLIRLDLLDESEMKSLEDFFRSQSAGYSTFIFPDPLSGEDVPNCRFGSDAMSSGYKGLDKCHTSFWVVETNG